MPLFSPFLFSVLNDYLSTNHTFNLKYEVFKISVPMLSLFKKFYFWFFLRHLCCSSAIWFQTTEVEAKWGLVYRQSIYGLQLSPVTAQQYPHAVKRLQVQSGVQRVHRLHEQPGEEMSVRNEQQKPALFSYCCGFAWWWWHTKIKPNCTSSSCLSSFLSSPVSRGDVWVSPAKKRGCISERKISADPKRQMVLFNSCISTFLPVTNLQHWI